MQRQLLNWNPDHKAGTLGPPVWLIPNASVVLFCNIWGNGKPHSSSPLLLLDRDLFSRKNGSKICSAASPVLLNELLTGKLPDPENRKALLDNHLHPYPNPIFYPAQRSQQKESRPSVSDFCFGFLSEFPPVLSGVNC